MDKKNNTGHFGRKQPSWWTKKHLLVLIAAVAVLLVVEGIFAIRLSRRQDAPQETTAAPTTVETTVATTAAPTTEPETEPTTVPTEPPPEILPEFAELYEQNNDLAGWITIDGTVIDYPVMFTPDDPEKYIYANFAGKFDANGLPFIDGNCSMDPESDNLIIYGHNMTSGAMFAKLVKYQQKDFWQRNPIIHFSTLYENREYEVVAAFYDQVYKKTDTCFKFYKFIDAESEEAFQEAMTYYKEHALYDTGVTASYGDKLITLVTCAYHVNNGRFVVVAREKTAE